MAVAVKSRQRGISFITLIFILAVLGGLGAVVLQTLPSFLEYQATIKAVNKAKEGATVAEVRNIFDKAAQVDDITSITGKDLEVTKNGDQVVVAFSYQKEFHLFGPAWLLMKYAGQSRPGR
jgi:sensor histidine kinase regulating citrate/malate metabolism